MPPRRTLNGPEFDAYMEWLEERQSTCELDAVSPATKGRLTWAVHYATLATVYELCRTKAARIVFPPYQSKD